MILYMSRVVLLAINSKFVHSSLAVWVIAGGVSKYASLLHDVKVVETTIHQANDDIVEDITAYSPDVVGISTYIWNAAKLPELLKLLKASLPKATLVLGGPEAAYNTEYWLARGADYVLCGNGEYAFPPLLDALVGGTTPIARELPSRDAPVAARKSSSRAAPVAARESPFRDAPVAARELPFRDAPIAREFPSGDTSVAAKESPSRAATVAARELPFRDAPVAARKSPSGGAPISQESLPESKYVWTEPRSCAEPIDPYNEEYFNALNGRIAYIETSRGCPFRCTFCLSGGSGVVFFPIDAVKEQLKKLSSSDAQTIKLVDRTFNCNAERALELFEFIIDLDVDRHFHFEIAADLLDDRTLSLLSQAPPGRIQLEAGLQSFYEPALKASLRHMDIDKAERNVRLLLREGNIHVHIDLIAGLPYESLSVFQDGFDRAFMLGAHTLQLGFLKMLHGSVLRSQAASLGVQYNPDPPYEIICSPWLDRADLRILKEAENALQRTYNKSRFLSAIRYVLSVSGLRPFALFRTLGKAAPNCGMHLIDYARQIFDCFTKLPNVREDALLDHMVCDWLSMVKGENMPQFMRNVNERHKQTRRMAEISLGHAVARNEAAVLLSGVTAYVDSHDRDPVTGLYRLHLSDASMRNTSMSKYINEKYIDE